MRRFKNSAGLGCWQLVTVIVLAVGWSWLAPAAAGQKYVEKTKMSWDVGTYKVEGDEREHKVQFKDAHVKLAITDGIFDTDAPIKIEKNGFDKSSDPVFENNPETKVDCMTIDWSMNADSMPLMGKHTIGIEFQRIGGKGTRVVRSNLTGVRIATLHGGTELGELAMPAPTDPNKNPKKSKSVDWDFSFSDPALTGPVTFSSVEFYKTIVEPPLESLNSTDFPLLPKIFLQVEPDFVLPPGAIHPVHVEDVDYPEWLIANYTTSWTDPTLSAIVGSPVTVDATQWVAVQVVPEPSTLILVGSGFVGLLTFARRRKPAAGTDQ